MPSRVEYLLVLLGLQGLPSAFLFGIPQLSFRGRTGATSEADLRCLNLDSHLCDKRVVILDQDTTRHDHDVSPKGTNVTGSLRPIFLPSGYYLWQWRHEIRTLFIVEIVVNRERSDEPWLLFCFFCLPRAGDCFTVLLCEQSRFGLCLLARCNICFTDE